MNFSTLFLLIGVFGVVTIFRFYVNTKKREKQRREEMRLSVTRHRLYKMLSYIGVNFDSYLNKLPKNTIVQHVTNCKACPNIETCDRCLHDGKIISDMNFCPNFQSITSLSRLLKTDR